MVVANRVETETGVGVKVIGFREMDGEGGATYYGFTGQSTVQSGAKITACLNFFFFTARPGPADAHPISPDGTTLT